MSTLAIEAIGLYRRHLSPRKGFRCAHHALHQVGSCSDFGLRVYGRLTFYQATALMVLRLRDCRSAYATIMRQSRKPKANETPRGGNRGHGGFGHTLDAISCVPIPDAACADIGACDCLGGLF